VRFEKKLDVGRIQALPAVKTCFKGRRTFDDALLVHYQPFRMLACSVMVPPDSGIDRDTNIMSMAGLDLRLEQVDCQVRMSSLWVYYRVVVNPTMVTAGTTGNRIDPLFFQGSCKFFGLNSAPTPSTN
jgi:hypothetical protein